MQKLKVDHQFTPCPSLQGDEAFGRYPFTWNITALAAWLAKHQDEVAFSMVKIAPPAPLRDSANLNEAYIPTVDLAKPLIVVRMRPEAYTLIDGHHRVAKARRDGVKELPAYYLNERQHRQFFIHLASDRLYVDYWNEKLDTAKKYGAPIAKVGDLIV